MWSDPNSLNKKENDQKIDYLEIKKYLDDIWLKEEIKGKSLTILKATKRGTL